MKSVYLSYQTNIGWLQVANILEACSIIVLFFVPKWILHYVIYYDSEVGLKVLLSTIGTLIAVAYVFALMGHA